MVSTRYFFFFLLLAFIGCSSGTPENMQQRVDQLIAENQYEDALDLLDGADSAETPADLQMLAEKVHLNYGIFLEYQGEESTGMRERMTGALRQFVEVLKINPDNQKALSEVEQIMGIYATMPDKSPGEDIIDDLRELGFDY
jgi:hypothetical protein